MLLDLLSHKFLLDRVRSKNVCIKTMLDSLKNGLSKWCQMTSCHGIIDWFESKGFIRKTLWTLLILASLGVAIWQVSELFDDFFSGPHYRTSTYSRDLGYIDLPNVTVCNFNRAHRNRSIAIGMTMEKDHSKLDPDYLNYLYTGFWGTYQLGYSHIFSLILALLVLCLLHTKRPAVYAVCQMYLCVILW